MTDATLLEVMDALATQLQTQLDPGEDDFQVVGRMMFNPTPPAIDIYPAADPFQEPSGFGGQDTTINLIIRARVSTVEHEGAQDTLLAFMDPGGANSVVRAVAYDRTLSGTVQDAVCDPPSDFGAFLEPIGTGALLGCTWTARITL